jgi:hypothetical protein
VTHRVEVRNGLETDREQRQADGHRPGFTQSKDPPSGRDPTDDGTDALHGDHDAGKGWLLAEEVQHRVDRSLCEANHDQHQGEGDQDVPQYRLVRQVLDAARHLMPPVLLTALGSLLPQRN